MSTSPPALHLNPEAAPSAIVDHLLKEAADRARRCGNSQDFLTYATAISKLAETRQALSAQSLFSVPPEVLGHVVSAPKPEPEPFDFFAPTKTPTPEQLAYGGYLDYRGNFRARRLPQARVKDANGDQPSDAVEPRAQETAPVGQRHCEPAEASRALSSPTSSSPSSSSCFHPVGSGPDAFDEGGPSSTQPAGGAA